MNRWSLGLRAATRQVTAERLLANAVFDAPHDAVVFGEAANRTLQALVRAAQSVVSAVRTPEKVGQPASETFLAPQSAVGTVLLQVRAGVHDSMWAATLSWATAAVEA